MALVGPLMDRNLVARRVRERKRLISPGLGGKPRVLFLGLTLLHVGTGRPLERVKAVCLLERVLEAQARK